MGIVIGILVGVGCMIGGFVAMGGHVAVMWQPWEFVMICGLALGVFITINSLATISDTGSALIDAFGGRVPKRMDFLELLGCLYALMRDLRSRPRNEVEAHCDNPEGSELFKAFPRVLKNTLLTHFLCDYVRLMIIGNARPHELDALMEQEIATIRHSKMKPALALAIIGDSLPALGIVGAVLGIVKAMGAIDQAPEILGGYIGAALIGTFAGIFLSYAVVAPISQKVRLVREKQLEPYLIARQSLIAFMNGALPQVALEHGRKSIPAHARPTIDEVEEEALGTSSTESVRDSKAA